MIHVAPEKTVLVFQGGGALGAYQAGVFEALVHADRSPDWVIGTSIGAINSALIAGNRPENRMPHLVEFWRRMGKGLHTDAPTTMSALLPWFQHWNTAALIGAGLPNFFNWRPLPLFGLGMPVATEQASFYDTSALGENLRELIDFNYLRSSPVRLSVGAVDIESGQMRYFDSQKETLQVEHIMASGALPPAFAPVEIEGRYYWDGGIHSNTPLEYLLQDYPRFHSLCFLANLWPQSDSLPTTLAAVQRRSKELQYASRTDTLAKMEAELHCLRHSLGVLEEHLKPDALELDDVQKAINMGCLSVFHLIRLQAPRLEAEDQYKDIEFTPDRVRARWGAGYVATSQVLQDKPWEAAISVHDGVLLYDYSMENVDADRSRLHRFHEPHQRDGSVCIYKRKN